jgi:Uma2 family endonuclease
MRLDSYSDSSILSSTIQWALPERKARSMASISMPTLADMPIQAPIEREPPIENQVEVRLLSHLMWFWAEQPDTGLVLSRETAFHLLTGQLCAPIAAWVSGDRLNSQSNLQSQQSANSSCVSADSPVYPNFPICPNFVVEIRGSGDRFNTLDQQMQTYLQNPGMQLGWLIDCENRSLYIYRPNKPVLCLSHPELVSTAPILPGFVLDWRSLW